MQEINSLACLRYLPAWPHLRTLLLRDMQPTRITEEHVALLAAAPSLRRLGMQVRTPVWDTAHRMEKQRIQVCRRAAGHAACCLLVLALALSSWFPGLHLPAVKA